MEDRGKKIVAYGDKLKQYQPKSVNNSSIIDQNGASVGKIYAMKLAVVRGIKFAELKKLMFLVDFRRIIFRTKRRFSLPLPSEVSALHILICKFDRCGLNKHCFVIFLQFVSRNLVFVLDIKVQNICVKIMSSSTSKVEVVEDDSRKPVCLIISGLSFFLNFLVY